MIPIDELLELAYLEIFFSIFVSNHHVKITILLILLVLLFGEVENFNIHQFGYKLWLVRNIRSDNALEARECGDRLILLLFSRLFTKVVCFDSFCNCDSHRDQKLWSSIDSDFSFIFKFLFHLLFEFGVVERDGFTNYELSSRIRVIDKCFGLSRVSQ